LSFILEDSIYSDITQTSSFFFTSDNRVFFRARLAFAAQMTRVIRSQTNRETFMIIDISSQNDQDQSLNDQNTQILNAKDNFHVDLDVNLVDSKKQRVIDDAQTDFLRNADVVSDDVSRVESNVVSDEVFRVVSTSSISNSFIRISAHKARNVFSENTFRIIFRMSNARASKTIRLIEFIL
jgi:hypothetical protein